MDTSESVHVPARSNARPIQPLSSSLMDKFLGMGLSPASVQSLSSDTSDANDLDDLDEQEIWGMEISGGKGHGQAASSVGQAPLPPRMASTSRRFYGTPESRSGSSGTSWISSTVNSLSSISGTLSGFSPLGGSGDSSRSPAARVLSSEATARRVPSASRMIPRMSPQLVEVPSSSIVMMPQSAPLNIPHWSKFEGISGPLHPKTSRDGDEGEDEKDERLPPHEFLAREYARSQKISFSVLEGAGRTLKGRDLSRVRNAVLSYTGFVE